MITFLLKLICQAEMIYETCCAFLGEVLIVKA